MPLWWNWQTRLTQNQVGLTPVPVQLRPAALLAGSLVRHSPKDEGGTPASGII